MKKFFLPALIWAWAMNHLFGQNSISQPVKDYAWNLPASAKQLLSISGYPEPDQKTGPAFKLLNSLQLDSTITYFGYDPSGAMDSFPQSRTIHIYRPRLGAEIVWEYVFEDETWFPINRTTSYRDEQGRLVDVMAEWYDPEKLTWTLDSRLEQYRRGNSQDLVDSLFVYAWSADSLDWIRLMSVWNVFDAEENLLESHTLVDVFGQALLYKDVYTYDSAGDNVLIESFLVDGGFEISGGKREFTFSNHHVTSVTAFTGDGLGGFVPTDRITYTYKSFWKEETVNSYAWDPLKNDWLLTQSDEYEYDLELRMSAKVSTLFNQEPETAIYRTGYSYLEGENISVETNEKYDSDLEVFSILDKKFYYYSGDPTTATPPEPSPELTLNVFPNPTSGRVEIQSPEEVLVQVYDIQGQLVQRFYLKAGRETLNLEGLPNGMYHLKAIGQSAFQTARIIKI